MFLLTVVTVVKDDETGLRNTLASLQSQDFPDFEILVLDGSTNRNAVPEVLSNFADLSSTYRWAEPTGVYGAMNASLNHVVTPYTYFLNAGDELAGNDVLERVVGALRSVMPVWAYGRVLFFNESGAPLPEPSWTYARECGRLFARGFFPAHQGVVVATDELRRQGGFDQAYLVAADYTSILKLSRVSKPLELDFPLALFRQGGLSTTQWRRGLKEFHLARRSVYRPTGKGALLEYWDTLWLGFKTYAFHTAKRVRFNQAAQDSSASNG